MTEAKRLKLHELSVAQIEPLEKLFTPQWPDVWKDLARCFFITLISQPVQSVQPAMQPQELAVALTLGMAQDFGGTQPYIPCGQSQATRDRTNKAIELLRAGHDYQDVAQACGLTVSRVRNIERQNRRARAKPKP